MSFGTTHALTTRPIVMGRSSGVVAGHHLAAQAGMHVLRTGGNAMDAAITAAAALAVLKPDACGLGSDLFLVYHDARTGEPHALNASGPAPKLATPAEYPEGIAPLGIAASAVPGAVHGWQNALERFGTRTLAECLAPAIDLARNGMPVSALFGSTLETNRTKLGSYAGTQAVFYAGDRAPRVGELLVQSDLADVLDEIARDGARGFYSGTFGRALDAYATKQGGFLRLADLEAYASTWAPALHAAYRGYDICGQPPVSVGIAVLEAMQIIAQFDVPAIDPESADFIHLHLEALKLALADMRGNIGDPAFVHTRALETLLDPAYAAQRARDIDMKHAGGALPRDVGATAGTDTSYAAAIDVHGNAVSLLQSVFNVFGSGEVVPGTGALMNNRMIGFSLDPASPNVLAPGKRTLHTLNPFIVRAPDGRVLCMGTPGGPCQTYTNAILMMRVLDHGFDLQRAVDAPRWFLADTQRLQIEDPVPLEVRRELEARGHVLNVVPRHSAALGGAGMVRINPSGIREAAADPRRESYALAG
jgi:gamma-glutamyltranspeptidase/glutathione hydrolase